MNNDQLIAAVEMGYPVTASSNWNYDHSAAFKAKLNYPHNISYTNAWAPA